MPKKPTEKIVKKSIPKAEKSDVDDKILDLANRLHFSAGKDFYKLSAGDKIKEIKVFADSIGVNVDSEIDNLKKII